MAEFETHLSEVTNNLERRREDLLATLAELNDADLVHARRGGWTIGKVLEHVISSEWHYAQLVSSLRRTDSVAPGNQATVSVADVLEALGCSRQALLKAVDGVTQDDFYRLGNVGREEYSVVSVLENVEQHDMEHLGQIRSILDRAE